MESATPADEKAFIEFLINYIVDKEPNYMRTDLAKVTKHLQNDFKATDPLNLYRKQFGNLKDCVQKAGIKQVLELEGTNFKFLETAKVEAAFNAGVISEDAWKKYSAGQEIHLAYQEKFFGKK